MLYNMLMDFDNYSIDEELYGCNRRIILVEKVTKVSLEQKKLKVVYKKLNACIEDVIQFTKWRTTIEDVKVEDDSFVVDITLRRENVIEMVDLDFTVYPTHTMIMDKWEDIDLTNKKSGGE